MGKVSKWSRLEQERRMAARGSERADGGSPAPLVLHAAPKSGARLEAYLSKPLAPLPDPVDALGEPMWLTEKEEWLRSILGACEE